MIVEIKEMSDDTMKTKEIEVVTILEDQLGVKIPLPTYLCQNPFNPTQFLDDELLRFLTRAANEKGYELPLEKLIPPSIVLELDENIESVVHIEPNLLTRFNQLLYKHDYVIDTAFSSAPTYLKDEHALLFEVTSLKEEKDS